MFNISSHAICSAEPFVPANMQGENAHALVKKVEFLPQETPRGANFSYLYDRGVIDIDGNLTPRYANISVPRAGNIFDDLLKPLLKSKVTSGSNTTPTVENVLHHLKKSTEFHGKFEIVGGFLRYLILSHPEYIHAVLKQFDINDFEKIHIPTATLPPDCDIRCLFLNVSDEETYRLNNEVIEFVKSKMGAAFKQDEVILKKYYYYDAFTRYGVVTFKGSEGIDHEFLIVQKLGRKSLFKHDAMRLVINSMLMETKGSNLLVSDYELQPIIDLLTGMIHIDKPEEIDHQGWPLLISFYTRGFTLPDRKDPASPGVNTESLLLKKSCSQNLYKLLKKSVKNHHFDSDAAEIAILFNASISLDIEKVIIKTLWDQLLPIETPDNKDLLWGIRKLIKEEHVPFDLLLSCMQIFSLLHLQQSNENVNFVRHHGEKWIQIRIGDNHLLIPFNLDQAFDRILNEKTDEIFKLLYQVWTPPISPTGPSQLHKYAEYLNLQTCRNNESLQTTVLGLPLRIILQGANPDHGFLIEMCNLLPDYIENHLNNPIEDLLFSLLENAFPNEASLFIDAKKLSIVEFRCKWIFILAESQEASLCKLSYQMFLQNKYDFSDKLLVYFINKLMPQDPFSSLSVFNRLTVFDSHLFVRIANALNITPEGKICLESQGRIRILGLKQSHFNQGCHVLTNRASPFYGDVQLTTEYFKEAILKNLEEYHEQIIQLLDSMLVIGFMKQIPAEMAQHKSEISADIISTLVKLRKENFLLPQLMIQRLIHCSGNICSYYKEMDQPRKIYEFLQLLEDYQIFPSQNAQAARHLLWALQCMLDKDDYCEKIKKGLFLLKNCPELPKEDLSTAIKTFRTIFNGTTLEVGSYFLQDVPEIYREGFETVFCDQAAAICRNLTKKAQFSEAVQLLKKYKITRSELWKNLFMKMIASNDIESRRLAFPLLFEHGERCGTVCWKEVLKTISLHKNKVVLSICDKLLSPETKEHKLFMETFNSDEERAETLEIFVYFLLDRLPNSSASFEIGNRICELRNLMVSLIKKDPSLEFDLNMIEKFGNCGVFDTVMISLISGRFNELRNPQWMERLFNAMILTVKTIKKDSDNYKRILELYVSGIYDKDAATFYVHFLLFLGKIEEVSNDLNNDSHPLLFTLLIEALPILIDYGSYQEKCFSFKLLSSEIFTKKVDPKKIATCWEKFISTRLKRMLLSSEVSHRNELILFLEHKDKLTLDSTTYRECMHSAVSHFCLFLNKEYDIHNDANFSLIFLDIFKKDDVCSMVLIKELIKSNPTTTASSEMICSMIGTQLLTLSKQKKIPKDILCELFNNFFLMIVHSPSTDRKVLNKNVISILKSIQKVKLLSSIKIVKWALFHDITNEIFTGKVEEKILREASLDLFNDFQIFDKTEYLYYSIEILKSMQAYLVKAKISDLKKCYNYLIKKFSNAPQLFVVHQKEAEALETALKELNTLLIGKNKKIFISIENEWRAVCKKSEEVLGKLLIDHLSH